MVIFNLRIITERRLRGEETERLSRRICRAYNSSPRLARQCFQDIAPRFSAMFSATFNPGFILALSFALPRLVPLGDAFYGSKAAAS